jgi:lipopolysaccharide export system permease protein
LAPRIVKRRLLPIIDGYVLGQTLKVFGAAVLVLLMALFAFGFVRLLGRVAAGSIPADVVLPLVGLELLRVLGLLMPPAFFMAVLFVIGRMYRDSEMGALATCGVGTFRIYRAVFAAALPVALASGLLVMLLLPRANQWIDVLRNARSDLTELAGISAGQFNEYSRGDLVLYVESISDDRSRLHNVFVQHRQHDRLGIVRAEEGYSYVDEPTGDRFVVFEAGRRYEGVAGSAEFSVSEFDQYGVRIRRSDVEARVPPRKARPTSELVRSRDVRDKAEFQYRMLVPLSVLAFTLISVPLSRSLPRQGVAGRLLLAILIYFVFTNLQRAATAWMESGATPTWIGIWWVPLLMALLAGVLVVTDSLRFVAWRRRLLARLRG